MWQCIMRAVSHVDGCMPLRLGFDERLAVRLTHCAGSALEVSNKLGAQRNQSRISISLRPGTVQGLLTRAPKPVPSKLRQ